MTHKPNPNLFERLRFRGDPVAHPDSIVVSGNARFTVLTPRLLRLEWSETGEFEDRCTYAFPTRHAPPVEFTMQRSGNVLTLDTGCLSLCYVETSSSFTADNLTITFELNGRPQTWRPGTPNPSNLRGTRRTLDNCGDDAALEEGLLSRAGWSLFDDSHSVRFDPEEGWVLPPRQHRVQDWYFFGYGHDYKAALAEYARFGGKIPLIPRYVLGAWWSRYWAYSADDLKSLVRDFEVHDLPLDVLVIDMDWHTPHSWTGYTWNRELFPDPPAFLCWLHDKGLRVALNLHPAEGVQSFEEVYPRFAQAIGLDPSGGEAVPFRITDKRFVQNYFELLHHPMEDDGVDFWWMDWQQGDTSEMEGLDPLLWINHLHFADSARRGRRPLLYSRWGGLGNHRYQTGFSGDTWVGWSALQFQPYFTAAASNVLYGWWGHDIGGHMGDATEPELYARWVQYGALSPSLRLHATKDPKAERRPWAYPDEVYETAKAAFHWRYQLLPYLYTMACVAHDSGLSLCRPMYYEYPEEDAAYAARYQYFFGDQMIAAPIVSPADRDTGLATIDVWVPPGEWIDYQTKETFSGPRWVRLVGGLERLPMLVRAGAILPLAAPFEAPTGDRLASGTSDALPRDRLVLSVWPGAQDSFRLYEDDGLTEAYRDGQCEWTTITTRMDDPDTWLVHIAPVEGRCDELPRQRGYEIRLEGSHPPERVILDGKEISNWHYDPDALRTTIQVPACDKSQAITVTAIAEGGLSALGEAHNRRVVRADVERLIGQSIPEEEQDLFDAVLRADAPGGVEALVRLGAPFLRFIEFTTPEEASQKLGRIIVGAPATDDEAYDLEVTWTLFRGGQAERHVTHIEGTTSSQIVDAPFAFDGQVGMARWQAEARLTWRGATIDKSHQSNILFPAIYAWRAVVYDREQAPLTPEQVMDDAGNLNAGLDWQTYQQTTEGLANVNQPHGIFLSRQYEQALKAGAPLAAYLSTIIVSPDEREAMLRFRCAGRAEFYLNGQPVEEILVEQEDWLPGLLRQTRRTATIGLHVGKNNLVVHTCPPEEMRPWWYFGGALTTPDGELMDDLTFR